METKIRCPACEDSLLMTLVEDSRELEDREFSGWDKKEEVVREEVQSSVVSIECKGPDKIYDVIYDETSALFDSIVTDQKLSEFTLQDMVDTLPTTTAIIKIACDEAWVGDADDKWYSESPAGFLASVAYNSLINVLVRRISDRDNDIDIVL